MTLLATPLYRATATVEIKRQETQIMKEIVDRAGRGQRSGGDGDLCSA